MRLLGCGSSCPLLSSVLFYPQGRKPLSMYTLANFPQIRPKDFLAFLQEGSVRRWQKKIHPIQNWKNSPKLIDSVKVKSKSVPFYPQGRKPLSMYTLANFPQIRPKDFLAFLQEGSVRRWQKKIHPIQNWKNSPKLIDSVKVKSKSVPFYPQGRKPLSMYTFANFPQIRPKDFLAFFRKVQYDDGKRKFTPFKLGKIHQN